MRALFINLLLMGDVVNTAHVAAAFSEYNKGWDVDLLTNLGNRGIADVCKPFSNTFYIDRVGLMHEMANPERSVLEKYYIIQDELFGALDNEYDLVINLTHNKLSSIISSLVKTKKRPGVYLGSDRKIVIEDENGWMSYFNEFVTSDKYNSFQYIDVFKKVLNIPCKKETLEVIKSGVSMLDGLYSEDEYFILKPTSSESNKDWGQDNYIELARMITEKKGLKCLIVGVDSERLMLKEIRDAVGSKAEVGVYSLSELKKKIDRAKFIIGGDTGILHLAAAMRKKVVTVTLGPGTYFKSTPYGDDNLIIYPREACYPCPHATPCTRKNVCRDNIKPQSVYNAIFNKKINSAECGALLTYFDQDGYLSYRNINDNQWDVKLCEMMNHRAIIKSFMETQRQYNKFDSNELRASIKRQS